MVVPGLSDVLDKCEELVRAWRLENDKRTKVVLINREIQLAQEALQDLEDEQSGGIKKVPPSTLSPEP